MGYAVKEPFWQLIDHWQTLIGTLISSFFAVVAAFGTVWATIRSARREIAAAQAQTAVAQEQIETTLRIEQRRIAREAWAFYVMLEEAMTVVLNDIGVVRKYSVPGRDYTMPAYQARQRIKKSGFAELREACLRHGGQLTAPFLHLDNDIDNFTGDWRPGQSVTGVAIRLGKGEGLSEELDRLDRQATFLREQAGDARKKSLNLLASLGVPVAPC